MAAGRSTAAAASASPAEKDRAVSPHFRRPGLAVLVDSCAAMEPRLDGVLRTLRSHQGELQALGVTHAAVFGSVARGDARADSDIDVLVDLDRERPMGIFEYARLKLYIGELLGQAADVVNRKTLKPLLREHVLHDAIDAF